jgi:hypothetical protein
MLSFPRPGVTLTLDLAVHRETFRLLNELDRIVFDADGALYPAKDARMSDEGFQRSFPALDRFLPHVDPNFSSNFWRRVAGQENLMSQ